jgi:formylglycine-generating enzyme required for sulfatase activity
VSDFKYCAFLSYSHADSRWAKRVHQRLEAFHIDKDLVGRDTPRGRIPESIRPIFRDRHDFDSGGLLALQTSKALESSAALIVLASPNAARSKAVNEEIREFKAQYPDRPVVPLIIGGHPGDSSNECFPQALQFPNRADGAITSTPLDVLAADLRESGDGFNLALAKVVASLIGISPDDIYRRADRERRLRARRLRWVQALVFTLMSAIIVGLIAWMNQSYIIEQWNWYSRMRPYMVANVRPYVLTTTAERELRPGATFRECAQNCPEMIVIPPGEFLMGSPANEPGRSNNEGPQHLVTIVKPFAVSKYDVTFDDWDACVSVGGCSKVADFKGRGMQPVINVSWNDAEAYIRWLSTMTGKIYRLLSEAEWEYVARAGTTTAHFWGDNAADGTEYCRGCEDGPALQRSLPVGSLKPNGFGLYDMEGNVWQWVEDCSHDNYNGAPTDGSAWHSVECDVHMNRGGAANHSPRPPRIAVRISHPRDNKIANLGFRVARTLMLEAEASRP